MVIFNIACVFNLLVCIVCFEEVTQLLLDEVKALKTELSTLKKSCVMKSDYTGMENPKMLVLSNNEDSNHQTVAFSAYVSNSFDGPAFGKLREVVYDKLETNVGNAYNNYTGTFVAPVKGIYAFSWTIFAKGKADATGAYGEIAVELTVNSVGHGYTHADTETGGDDDSATGFVIKSLQSGDSVFVRSINRWTPQGVLQSNNGDARWTFSGWLLY